MAQAAPVLLLLFLLLMGSQGKVLKKKYEEGQTLRVSCGYNPWRAEKSWKTWCKVRKDGKMCDRLITRNSIFTEQLCNPQASLEDDTYTGIITITMSNLRVKDSGIYWCGIYDPVSDTTDILRTIRLEVSPGTTSKTTKHSQITTDSPLTTSAIPLGTSRPSHSSIFSSSPVIQVLCGLIVTKGLVFTALVVWLGRYRSCCKGRSHSELSQDQNDLK
ncbi:natural cytotoxicity triggering receptor 2-like [Phascolarctos cinereus]|uniref:Natural cytotoxicity triggering receptor 2-like n=1 Tax=Phascolarctos cinereus TaxID=38626 RepID=A0A6P5LAV4_PHACI|nr:natural cytotoxicity triggering receptor 2-like [Phascolarctos cinereus]